MGVGEVEALDLARKVAFYNSEAIYFVKNSLMQITPEIQKRLNNDYEKYTILIKDMFPKTDVNLVLADPIKNNNHDLTKLDVDLIFESFMEAFNESSN